MKKILSVLTLAFALSVGTLDEVPIAPAVALTACSPAAQQDANSALDGALTGAQIACVFGSLLTDAPALAKACKIADALLPSLIPILQGLIRQREGARKAGVVWAVPISDAGISDGRAAVDAAAGP